MAESREDVEIEARIRRNPAESREDVEPLCIDVKRLVSIRLVFERQCDLV